MLRCSDFILALSVPAQSATFHYFGRKRVILEPIGDGKIRVRTSTWDQEAVILVDQALEVVAMGKSLRVVRAPRPLEYLDYDPTGFADADSGPIK